MRLGIDLRQAGQRVVAVGGHVRVERERLELGLLLVRVRRGRVATQRQGDESPSRKLQGEVQQPRPPPPDPRLRVVEHHQDGREGPVAVRQEQISIVRHVPGGDLEPDVVLGDPIAPFLLQVLDPGLRDGRGPGPHDLVPGLLDLLAAPVPVAGISDRAPVAELQGRAIDAQAAAELGGRAEKHGGPDRERDDENPRPACDIHEPHLPGKMIHN